MARVTIDDFFCKGCGLCTDVCPVGILELDPDVITPRAITRPIAPTRTSAPVAPPARPCAPMWPSRLKGSSMAEKVLMKGNEAMAEAAMRAAAASSSVTPSRPRPRWPPIWRR